MRLASSVLGRVEVLRAIRRELGSGPFVAEADRILSAFELVRLDPAVLDLSARIDPPALRALDAVHVASALSLGSARPSFVTYDRQLGEAAELAGLRVEAPGAR